MVANDSLKHYLQYVLISDEAELSGDDNDDVIVSEPIVPAADDNSDVDNEPIRPLPPQSQDVKMPAQHCMYNTITERCNKANTGGIMNDVM